MTKPKKILAFCLLFCLMAAVFGSHGALAATTNLPDNFFIDDENGTSIKDAGTYFLYSENLMPGDVITRSLTLRNLEQGDPFRLHMLGESPQSAGDVDWLDNLHLRITLNGRELYAGRLRGDGEDTYSMQGNGVDLIHDGLDLGLFEKGDYGRLDFVVTADAGFMSAQDLTSASSASIDWVFTAAKNADTSEGPKTGEAVRNGLYILLLLLVILCAVFYVRYKEITMEARRASSEKQ